MASRTSSEPLELQSPLQPSSGSSTAPARDGSVDITGQKQLLALLRRRERELTEAHRIARLGTWSWIIADDTVRWSDEVYRVFGVL